MLIQNFQKIQDIKKNIKNLDPINLIIDNHYSFNEKFKQNLIDSTNINVDISNLKNNKISISFVFYVNEQEHSLLSVLEKNDTSVISGFSFSYDRLKMMELHNQQKECFQNRNSKKHNSLEEEFHNTIVKLENEIENKSNIVKRLKNIQKNIEKFSSDIYSFYEKILEPNKLKKIELEKKLDALIENSNNIIKTKCKNIFSINNEMTLNEFILEQTQMNSINDLKLRHNNTGTAIVLPITYSYVVSSILLNENFNPRLQNSISLNYFNFFKHELVHLYIKNNKMYFNSNSANSRADVEEIFRCRINFNGKLVNNNTLVSLSNGQKYDFFIDLEHSFSKQPNNKIENVFSFFDNV